MNEYISGFRSRYFEGTGQVFSYAADLENDVDDYDDDEFVFLSLN